MTDDIVQLSNQQAAELVGQFSDEMLYAVAKLAHEEDLILAARGDGVDAVVAFGEFVFGKIATKFHRTWIENDLTIKRSVTTAPPGSAKTTWQLILMTWWIAKHPTHSNAIASAGEDAADDMTKAVSDTIELNPNFKRVFPNIVPHKEKGWSSVGYNVRDTNVTEDEWNRRRAGDKNDTLVGGGVGSSRFNGFRVTGRLHLDDIHDRKSKHSDDICREAVEFVKDTALPRVTKRGYLSIRQTRWNPKDVVDWASQLKRADGSAIFAVFYTPAILENGESYWPEEHSLASINDVKETIGDIEFELVYQGNATILQGFLLKPEKLIYLNHTLLLREWPRYMGVDWAIKAAQMVGKKNKDPDEFAVAWMVDTGIGLCLEDGYSKRMSQSEAEDMLIYYLQLINPRSAYFEVTGGGEPFFQALWRRLAERGLTFPLVTYNPKVNLIERVTLEMEPDFARGYIKVSDADTPFLTKFKAQYTTFGRRSAHDDTLSAAYSARLAAGHLLPSRSIGTVRKPTPNPFASLGRVAAGV